MSFIAELKRRNVIRAAGLYLVGAWLVLQVAATLLPIYDTPGWVMKALVAVLAVGFLPAMIVAWVFELTPSGIKRDEDVKPEESIAPQTAQRMNQWLLVMSIVAIGYFAFDKFVLAPQRDAALVTQTTAHVTAEISAEKSKANSHSIAVLPFVNMSADPENEFFSDGLSEEILNSLARIDGMQVVGRTSSFQFKGKNQDLRKIGDQLGVGTVLEGSVRREGERARITAQLIRTSDGIHLWSETYDRTVSDSLAVQLDIAENVAAALDVLLDDKQRAHMRSAGVKNVEAFIAYQKGWKLYADAHWDPNIDLLDGLRLANAEFENAVALEPGFSFAHYAKADLYEHTLIDDTTSDAQRRDAQRAALQTLERAAATSPDAQQRDLALAERQMLSDDWRGLADRIDSALAQPGCSAPNWLPVFASMFGYGEALEDVLKRATVCDPLNGISWGTRIWVARANGNPRRMLGIFASRRHYQPQRAPAAYEAAALAMLGRITEAKRVLASVQDPEANEDGVALMVARLSGDDRKAASTLLQKSDRSHVKYREQEVIALEDAALFGTREDANKIAARLDARPAGGLLLAITMTYCGCGVPFDLDATPNFKARLAESGLRWPPPVAVHYPPGARKTIP